MGDGIRVVFFGSAAFACPSLAALLAEPAVWVTGVVTQPDRQKGRGLEVSACPVKAMVAARGIPILSPERVNEDASLEGLARLEMDLGVVVAYGQILKPRLLGTARLGFVNLHGSLLPRYRGAAPIQWAVANGDPVTGVSTMFVNERMDAGDVIEQVETPIGPRETGGSLHDRLAELGVSLLVRTVLAVAAGSARRVPQREELATYAPKLGKKDGRLDWQFPAARIESRIRGFQPWPGCSCEAPAGSGHWLKVLRAEVAAGVAGQPGEVAEVTGAGPRVVTGDGSLRLLEVQPEGRRAMSGAAYVCGHGVGKGVRLG